MKNLVKDASMGPLRDALRQGMEITKLDKEAMRPVNRQASKPYLLLEIAYTLLMSPFINFTS